MMIMTTITGSSIYLLLESTFPFTNLKENLHLWQGNLRSGMGGALPGSHLYTLHSQPTQALNGEVASGVLIFNICISYQTLPEPNTATSFAPSQTLPSSLAAFLPLSSHPLSWPLFQILLVVKNIWLILPPVWYSAHAQKLISNPQPCICLN